VQADGTGIATAQWIHMSQHWTSDRPSEHSDGISISVKCGEFFDWLLQKDCCTGVWIELHEKELQHLNCRAKIIKLGTTRRKGKGAPGVGEGLRQT